MAEVEWSYLNSDYSDDLSDLWSLDCSDDLWFSSDCSYDL
jgi:hypothetical protein